MSDFIQVQWTCGSIDEARKVSRFLVQNRLVACANIIPWTESIYMWDNALDTSQETKVLFKTHKNHFERVKKVILENTSYELPEILSFPVLEGHKEYLDWIESSVNETASPV